MFRIRNNGCQFFVLILMACAAGGCGSPSPQEAEDSEPALPATPEQFVAGEALYNANCAACHDTSKEGAPRLGFLRAWKKRLGQGEDSLVQRAIDGVDLMPPRGDNPDLTDDEVRSIVQYMMYRAELEFPAG